MLSECPDTDPEGTRGHADFNWNFPWIEHREVDTCLHASQRYSKNGTGTFGIILILKPMSITHTHTHTHTDLYFHMCFFYVCGMFSIKYYVLFLNYGYIYCLIGFYLNINLNIIKPFMLILLRYYSNKIIKIK